MTSIKDLRVAIVGGGVCGLTCAIALAKKGIRAHIYEAAAEFGEIGAAIGIGPTAVRVLHDLDLLKDVLTKADASDPNAEVSWFQFRSGLDDHEIIYEYALKPGEQSIGMHRAAFLDALVDHVDPQLTHFNKRCINVTPSTTDSSRLILYFADGNNDEADIVLGADGIKSAVRAAVAGADLGKTLKFSNNVCYRGLVPTEIVKAAGVKLNFVIPRPICFVGKDRHIIVFSIKNGLLLNVVAFVAKHDIPPNEVEPNSSTVVHATTEQLLKDYEGWGSDVIGLLGCIEQPDKWNINVVYPPLQSYVKGNVALLGDAAHGMLPHLGAGAGQGIEDAYLLAQLLGHPQATAENVESIFKAYDAIRRPRAQKVWDGSVHAGEIFDGCGPSGFTPEGLRQDLAGMWDFVWTHGLDEDSKSATKMLQEQGVFTLHKL